VNENSLVWNVIFTPGTFRYLQRLTASLVENTTARFRLVANGCPAAEREAIAAAAAARIDAYTLPGDGVVPHGRALTHLFDTFADGENFCFVDSDVLARGPWIAFLLDALDGHAAVTSCDVAWTDDNVLPEGAEDLVGRHTVGTDGFVYGSSFLALYRRRPVTAVRDRFGVTFAACAHDHLGADARRGIERTGRAFRLYDTAKALNLLLRSDGDTITHVAHPTLRHLGGISQYLSQVQPVVPIHRAGVRRLEFAGWAAALLVALTDGTRPPPVPVAVDSAVATEIADALGALFARGPGEDDRR